MSFGGCPGQDKRNWTPQDISFQRCSGCGNEVEIWKDEPARLCPKCGATVRNPAAAQDCEKWCSLADQCPGVILNRKERE